MNAQIESDDFILDFCEIAIMSAGDTLFTFRYTYFEGYLVLLSRRQSDNAEILKIEGPVYDQRKRFREGIGKGRRVCIKIFPLILTSSEECIKFVLYHEIGHIRNKDFTIDKYRDIRKESIISGNVVLPELRADMYAAKKIGKLNSLGALNEILHRKSKSLDQMVSFEKKYSEQILKDKLLQKNFESQKRNAELAILELNRRIESMESLNIK